MKDRGREFLLCWHSSSSSLFDVLDGQTAAAMRSNSLIGIFDDVDANPLSPPISADAPRATILGNNMHDETTTPKRPDDAALIPLRSPSRSGLVGLLCGELYAAVSDVAVDGSVDFHHRRISRFFRTPLGLEKACCCCCCFRWW